MMLLVLATWRGAAWPGRRWRAAAAASILYAIIVCARCCSCCCFLRFSRSSFQCSAHTFVILNRCAVCTLSTLSHLYTSHPSTQILSTFGANCGKVSPCVCVCILRGSVLRIIIIFQLFFLLSFCCSFCPSHFPPSHTSDPAFASIFIESFFVASVSLSFIFFFFSFLFPFFFFVVFRFAVCALCGQFSVERR